MCLQILCAVTSHEDRPAVRLVQLSRLSDIASVGRNGAVACCRVDPFDPDSPIKALPVDKFPSDMFFVLRVVQLLRGLANAMDPDLEFSSASQVPSQRLPSWTPACCHFTRHKHRMRRGHSTARRVTAEVRCCVSCSGGRMRMMRCGACTAARRAALCRCGPRAGGRRSLPTRPRRCGHSEMMYNCRP